MDWKSAVGTEERYIHHQDSHTEHKAPVNNLDIIHYEIRTLSNKMIGLPHSAQASV